MLNKIQEVLDSLSKSERKVADLVLAQPNMVASAPIATVGAIVATGLVMIVTRDSKSIAPQFGDGGCTPSPRKLSVVTKMITYVRRTANSTSKAIQQSSIRSTCGPTSARVGVRQPISDVEEFPESDDRVFPRDSAVAVHGTVPQGDDHPRLVEDGRARSRLEARLVDQRRDVVLVGAL